jgi:hypothetical protein
MHDGNSERATIPLHPGNYSRIQLIEFLPREIPGLPSPRLPAIPVDRIGVIDHPPRNLFPIFILEKIPDRPERFIELIIRKECALNPIPPIFPMDRDPTISRGTPSFPSEGESGIPISQEGKMGVILELRHPGGQEHHRQKLMDRIGIDRPSLEFQTGRSSGHDQFQNIVSRDIAHPFPEDFLLVSGEYLDLIPSDIIPDFLRGCHIRGFSLPGIIDFLMGQTCRHS